MSGSLLDRLIAMGIDEDVNAICARHGVLLTDIVKHGRMAPVAAARHEVWALLRTMGWSYPFIAAAFGDWDHTTVMSGVRKANARRERVRAA